MNDIQARIRLLYAAIGATEETDPEKLRATVVATDSQIHFRQDFRGGLTDDDLTNQVLMVIHHIANLRDNLNNWARDNGHDRKAATEALRNSFALRIIQDLANTEKHGDRPPEGGWSSKYPQLGPINRVMQLQTQPRKGSVVVMTTEADGRPRFAGDGTAKAVVTCTVVDDNNCPIGEFREIADRAVTAWEQLLATFGLA